jgi:hypothetical protein
MIKHKHHILPRHAGGTDDPSNIVLLSVEEHAEAHKNLYNEHGKIEDRWAWLGLSGQIDKQELMRELAMSQKGKKKPEGFGLKISKANIGKTHTEESKLKMSLAKSGKKLSGEHKENIRLQRIGTKQSDSQKEKVSKALAKKYIITNPTGDKFEICNLRKYCRDNNLDQGNMSRNRIKGWSCEKLT